MDHENSKYMGKVDRKNGRSATSRLKKFTSEIHGQESGGRLSGKTIVLDMVKRNSDLTTTVVPYVKMNVDIVGG